MSTESAVADCAAQMRTLGGGTGVILVLDIVGYLYMVGGSFFGGGRSLVGVGVGKTGGGGFFLCHHTPVQAVLILCTLLVSRWFWRLGLL